MILWRKAPRTHYPMMKPAGKPFKLAIDGITVSSIVGCDLPEFIAALPVLLVDLDASKLCSSPLAKKPKPPDFALASAASPGR